MKRTIFYLLAFLSLGMEATAQIFSVANDVEALAAGDDVSINLHIAGASAMTSTHFKGVLPDELSLGIVEATTSWTVMFSKGDEGISAISTTENAFTGEGDIATIHIVVPENTAKGTYPVTINDFRVNGKTQTSSLQFNVKVVDRHTVVLDEESTTAPEAATGVDVRVKRTIVAGVWNTICLPFAMTEAQVKDVFGDDVKLGDFDGCESKFDEEDNVTGIKVNFDEVAAIAANHPYIIKVAADVEEFTVDNVNIEVEDEPSVDKDPYTVGKGKTATTYYNRFVGTYTANTVPEQTLFLNSSSFWYSKGATKMNGYRGYFDFYDVLASYDEAGTNARLRIVFNGATGVNDVKQAVVTDGSTYNLQGQRVVNPKKGAYIKNGKVVIIK